MERMPLVEIELADVKASAELHCLLRDALGFPGWYGCNWNAFWDAITGLVEMPETLCLRGWSKFQAGFPQDAAFMRDCLEEMAQKYPELAPRVVYA